MRDTLLAIFHRLKDSLDWVSLTLHTKTPPKTGAYLVVFLGFLVISCLGLGLGYISVAVSCTNSTICSLPVHYFLSMRNESCPPLTGDRLLTTVGEGDSFQGLLVALQCVAGYTPFPLTVKCQRKLEFDSVRLLEWSGLPLCYPTSLISPLHWSRVPGARSVSCWGNSRVSECRLQCVTDYISVEDSQYSCSSIPCRSWSLADKQCYRCDTNCSQLSSHTDPSPGDLLMSLGCDRDCEDLVVTSSAGAAIWQSKRTGKFSLVGEHRGKPLYQKNSTKEFLYFGDRGTEWLVGPDFTQSHGGLQFVSQGDNQCPERLDKHNMTKLYINSGVGQSGGAWEEDDTMEIQCYRKGTTPVEWCDCDHYDISLPKPTLGNGTYLNYLSGRYSKVATRDSYGLLAPLYLLEEKGLYLFSHHPKGLVWQVSSKLTTTPLRGVSSKSSCPDSDNLSWEWYNSTSQSGAQIYIPQPQMTVKCVTIQGRMRSLSFFRNKARKYQRSKQNKTQTVSNVRPAVGQHRTHSGPTVGQQGTHTDCATGFYIC